MKYILLLTLAAVGLMAADATGIWTGTFTPEGRDTGTAYMVLKQDGTKLTGTAGPSADQQEQIQNGKVEDGKLTFELVDHDTTMKFTLTQEGDQIKGDASREKDGEHQTAKVAVTRSK